MSGDIVTAGDAMDKQTFYDILKETPVICSAKAPEELEGCLQGDSAIVFVLFGDVITIGGIVAKIKQAGKHAFVHIDLVEGLATRDVSVDYLARNTQLDGIISTKANILRRAKELGLLTIHRFFVLDSRALSNIAKQAPFDYADAVEVLPGAMPKIIARVVGTTDKPVIASGLIIDKDDVIGALNAGAVSVSSTNSKIWCL